MCSWEMDSRSERFLSYLLWCNRLLAGLVKLLDGLLVVAKILLTSDEDDWEPLAEMQHFGDPLW